MTPRALACGGPTATSVHPEARRPPAAVPLEAHPDPLQPHIRTGLASQSTIQTFKGSTETPKSPLQEHTHHPQTISCLLPPFQVTPQASTTHILIPVFPLPNTRVPLQATYYFLPSLKALIQASVCPPQANTTPPQASVSPVQPHTRPLEAATRPDTRPFQPSLSPTHTNTRPIHATRSHFQTHTRPTQPPSRSLQVPKPLQSCIQGHKSSSAAQDTTSRTQAESNDPPSLTLTGIHSSTAHSTVTTASSIAVASVTATAAAAAAAMLCYVSEVLQLRLRGY